MKASVLSLSIVLPALLLLSACSSQQSVFNAAFVDDQDDVYASRADRQKVQTINYAPTTPSYYQSDRNAQPANNGYQSNSPLGSPTQNGGNSQQRGYEADYYVPGTTPQSYVPNSSVNTQGMANQAPDYYIPNPDNPAMRINTNLPQGNNPNKSVANTSGGDTYVTNNYYNSNNSYDNDFGYGSRWGFSPTWGLGFSPWGGLSYGIGIGTNLGWGNVLTVGIGNGWGFNRWGMGGGWGWNHAWYADPWCYGFNAGWNYGWGYNPWGWNSLGWWNNPWVCGPTWGGNPYRPWGNNTWDNGQRVNNQIARGPAGFIGNNNNGGGRAGANSGGRVGSTANNYPSAPSRNAGANSSGRAAAPGEIAPIQGGVTPAYVQDLNPSRNAVQSGGNAPVSGNGSQTSVGNSRNANTSLVEGALGTGINDGNYRGSSTVQGGNTGSGSVNQVPDRYRPANSPYDYVNSRNSNANVSSPANPSNSNVNSGRSIYTNDGMRGSGDYGSPTYSPNVGGNSGGSYNGSSAPRNRDVIGNSGSRQNGWSGNSGGAYSGGGSRNSSSSGSSGRSGSFGGGSIGGGSFGGGGGGGGSAPSAPSRNR